jgi:hypothetical protein
MSMSFMLVLNKEMLSFYTYLTEIKPILNKLKLWPKYSEHRHTTMNRGAKGICTIFNLTYQVQGFVLRFKT